MAAPEVVIHDIKEPMICPQDVFEILSRLSQPLPMHLTSDEVRQVISCTQDMYEEALRSPFLSLDNKNDDRPGRPVTDVLDTALSSVRMVKAASSFSNERRQSRTSWISLLALLGIAISEDVFISYETQPS